ncbi:hypothetical protein BKA69DRAFT_603714 [Paraphysoderma sedebokerense]|nr:hypothetical protein BKA69DRAFT_603714 [Paraphysoderma sedebokerense]
MDDLDEIDKTSESKLSNHGDPILENKKLSDFADEARNDSSPIFVVKESAIDTSILSSNISTEIVAPSSSVAIATPQPSLPDAPTLHPPRTVSRHKRPTHSTIAESKSAVSNTESAVSSATSMAALDLSTSTHSSTGSQLISQFGDDTSFPITSVKIIPPKRSTSLKKPSLDKRKDDKLPECETNAILQNSPSVNDGDDTKSDSASSVTPESPVLDAQFMTPTSSVISTLIPLPPSLQSRSAPKTALPSEDESSSSSPQSLPSSPANLSTSPSKSIIRSIFGFSLSTSNPPSSLPSSNGSAPISQSLPNISQPFPTATDSQTDPPIEFRVKRSESLPIISEKKKVVSIAQQRRKSSEVLGALNLETGSNGVESKVEPEKENAEPTGEPNELHSRQRKGSWSSWFRTNVAREKEKEKGLGDNNEESTTADSPVSLPVASTAPSNMPAATIDPVVKPKKSGLSSLFKASKKALQSSLSSSNQTKSSTKEASLDVTVVKYSSPLRYPLHIERAICRLAHQKLANPKRPLCHQVLISNMLVWYVGLRKREQEMMLANSVQAPNEAMQGETVNSTANGRNSDTSLQENGTNRNDVVVWKKGKLSAVDGSGKPRKKKKKRMNNGGRVEFVLPPVNYNNRNSVGEHVSPVSSVDFASQPKKRRKTKSGGKSRPRSKSVEASPGKDKSSRKAGDEFDSAANTWITDGADVSITMDQSGLSYQPSRVKIKKVSSGNGSSTHEHNVATVEASGYAQPQSAIIEDESSLQFSSDGLAATDENATGYPGGSDTSSASGSDVEMEDYYSDDTDGSGLSDASVDEDDDEVPLGLVFNRKKGGGSAVTSHTP